MTMEEFKPIAKALKNIYAEQSFLPDADALTTWHILLRDLPAPTVQQAALAYMQSNHFPPKPADLRELAAKISAGYQSGAGEGWQATLMAIRRYGYYREAEALAYIESTAGKSAADTAQQMGWQSLCLGEIDNMTADRAHYIRIFDQMAKREEEQRKLSPGLIEMINARRGEHAYLPQKDYAALNAKALQDYLSGAAPHTEGNRSMMDEAESFIPFELMHI